MFGWDTPSYLPSCSRQLIPLILYAWIAVRLEAFQFPTQARRSFSRPATDIGHSSFSSSTAQRIHGGRRLVLKALTTSNTQAIPPESTKEPVEEEALESLKEAPTSLTLGQWWDLISASWALLFRSSGVFAEGYDLDFVDYDASKYTIASFFEDFQVEESCATLPSSRRSFQSLVVYEFEGCPYCRKVRDAISRLGLQVIYVPCPKGGVRYRPSIKETYGKDCTFPFMVDPNTGIELFESDQIVQYLYQTYSTDADREDDDDDDDDDVIRAPSSITTTWTAGMALLPRFYRGGNLGYRPSKPCPQALRLWAYEGSPTCKLVREVLCEMELPHLQIPCPRGSPNRQRLFEQTEGTFDLPYLEDPNTDEALFGAFEIIDYLENQYEVEPSPVKYM